jgi:tetratricopeptide (TPR) repeat protein
MKWSNILNKGLAGLAVAFSLASTPAAADPAGMYIRKLYFTPPPAEACAQAAQRAGQASSDGLRACSGALKDPETDEEVRVAVLTNRAILYRRAGRFAEAASDCEEALASGRAVPGTIISCGGVYVDAGQPEKAVQVLSSADIVAPELQSRHYHNLALAHHDLGAYAQAYDYLEKALAAEPGFAPSAELKALYRVVEAE